VRRLRPTGPTSQESGHRERGIVGVNPGTEIPGRATQGSGVVVVAPPEGRVGTVTGTEGTGEATGDELEGRGCGVVVVVVVVDAVVVVVEPDPVPDPRVPVDPKGGKAVPA
jgi:hypothetical protein